MRKNILKLLENEYIRYLISGANTTFVNYLTYYICRQLQIPIVPSNCIAFIVAVSIAFVINKKWVYQKDGWEFKTILKEFTSFVSLRIVTMLYDTGALWLLVNTFGWNEYFVKVFNSIVVIILNYIFGKFITFRKG